MQRENITVILQAPHKLTRDRVMSDVIDGLKEVALTLRNLDLYDLMIGARREIERKESVLSILGFRLDTLHVNVDNENLSDSEFREFAQNHIELMQIDIRR